MLAEVAWTRAAPPALLTDASGMVLWLWYEVAVGMSVVVVVLSAYLAARRAPLVGGAAAGLGLVTLALARTAYSYRFTAGWVDVDDGGWEALRREARAERDGAEAEDAPDLGGDAPDEAEIAAARRESFKEHASRLAGLAACAAAASLGLVATAGAAAAGRASGAALLHAAACALLGAAAATLPLFAHGDRCAAALAAAGAAPAAVEVFRAAFYAALLPWAACAGLTFAATAAARCCRAADAALPVDARRAAYACRRRLEAVARARAPDADRRRFEGDAEPEPDDAFEPAGPAAGDIEAYLGASLHEAGDAAEPPEPPPRPEYARESPGSGSDASLGGLSDDFDDFEDRDSGDQYDDDFLPPPHVLYGAAAEAETVSAERRFAAPP